MRPDPKDDHDRLVRDEPKQIPPLLPPHILSVIRKADSEVFPAVSFNGGAHHSNLAKLPALATVTSQNANESRKRKAGGVSDLRKPVPGPSKKKREVATVSPTVLQQRHSVMFCLVQVFMNTSAMIRKQSRSTIKTNLNL